MRKYPAELKSIITKKTTSIKFRGCMLRISIAPGLDSGRRKFQTGKVNNVRILESDFLSRWKRGQGGWRILAWQIRPYWGKLMILGILAMGVSSAATLSLTSRETRTGASEEGVEISLVPSSAKVGVNEEQAFDLLVEANSYEVVSARLEIEYDSKLWELVDITPNGPMDEVVEESRDEPGLVYLSLGIKPRVDGDNYRITPLKGSMRVARLTLKAKPLTQPVETEVMIRRAKHTQEGSVVLAGGSGLMNVLSDARGSIVSIETR